MLARLYPHYSFGALRRVVGSDVFRVFGANYEPLMYGLAMLACYWLALYVLYRLRWFVRI